MTRLLPLIWTGFGASLMAAALVAPPFGVLALVAFLLGCVLENES